MLATLPKHKGTEKMQADLRRRLSQTRKEAQKKGGAHTAPFYWVEHEGAGQVALIGPPNSGKSRLVATLTHAQPEVGDYPFTTRFPTPGMLAFEDIQIQLVDLPPLAVEFMEPWLPQVIRHATKGILFVDLGDPGVLDEIEFILETLGRNHLPAPGLLIGNKLDLPGAAENYTALEDLYGERFHCLAVSLVTGRCLDCFARAIFDLLEIVRVYTKVPGKKADLAAPYVLRRGQTVLDAARQVHRDFADHLKFARLFHFATDRDGMMVERTHVLHDGDILEFHI